MRVYMLTDEDMQSLIDQLELEAMRKANVIGDSFKKIEVQDLHRSFHFVAVRWTQAHGYKGHR